MSGISSDIIRGYNDTMILYLLLDKPSYGYEISKEIKEQILEKEGRLPDAVLACVGGGSNASGFFAPFFAVF